jgi:hypothetical protein
MTTSDGVPALEHVHNPFFPAAPGGWQLEGGGAGDGLSYPGDSTSGTIPETSFDKSPSATWVYGTGTVLTEEPYWASGPAFSVKFGAYSAAQITYFINQPFDASAIVAIYKGKAYRGSALPKYENRLLILCQRSPADDPTA